MQLAELDITELARLSAPELLGWAFEHFGDRSAKDISLLDVAEAVEGRQWLPECLLGLDECSDDRACPTPTFRTKERSRIEKELKRQTLRDVAEFERKRGSPIGDCNCESGADHVAVIHGGIRPETPTCEGARTDR